MRSMKSALGLMAISNSIFGIGSAASHGKSKHPQKWFEYHRTEGSKPTTRRSKIKAARKANVQRLIKNK